MPQKVLLFIVFIASFVACTCAKEESEMSSKTQEKEIEELRLRLDAAEAQLLNVKTELSKYTKDSLTQKDSL